MPQRIECGSGEFRLQPAASIFVDAASRETGQYLAQRLRQATGYPFNVVVSSATATTTKGSIVLTTEAPETRLPPEGYKLEVNPASVVIRASGQAGLFYGIQTLLQLFPPDVFTAQPRQGREWMVPCMRIDDQPRFRWRGFMLDVSRHFFTKDEVKRLLDLMAMHTSVKQSALSLLASSGGVLSER